MPVISVRLSEQELKRLKALAKEQNKEKSADVVLNGTRLTPYLNRRGEKLSGQT